MNAARDLILALGILACPPLAVAQQPIRDFDLATVERLGRAIYEHDIAAWRATDVLLSENKAGRIADSDMTRISGWIVVGTPEERVVKFVAEGEQGPYAVSAYAFYRDRERATGAVPPAKGPLTEAEASHFRARQLAVPHVKRRCSDRYNIVVLPDTDSKGFLVYALAATGERDVMVVGGHYRFTVSADGRQIVQADELSLSCLTVSLKPPPGTEALTVVVVSHHVSSRPLETHVFLGLIHNRDIAVATGPETVWMVSKGKIRRF